MNYTLFYKMIKEAQAATPSTTPAPVSNTSVTAFNTPAPVSNTPANSRPTPPTPPQSTHVTPSNTYTPNPAISSGDVHDLVKNTPVPGMNPVPTAEQLANRWIQEKEDFYHSKAGKYPQYANWHVSNQTRDHLMQQAQDMIKEHSEEAARIWAQQPYNPKTDVYRDEAFQYANRNNEAYVKKQRKVRAKEEAAKQNSLMQNPTAPSAIQNPRQYDYSITGAQQFVRDWVRRYGNPASSMQLQSRFSNDFAHALPGFYQVPPGSTMWLEFSKDMRQKGLDPLGTMRSSIDNGYFDDPDAPAATSFEDMLKWYRKDLAQYGWAHSSTPEGQARIARANRYGRNLYDSHPAQSFQEDAYNRGINPYGNMANIVRDAYLNWGDNYILDNLKLN